MRFPWQVFAKRDEAGKLRGDKILHLVPAENDTMDSMMFNDWSYLFYGGFRLSDMQVLYAYIRHHFDEDAAADKLGTTKYVLRKRLKRMNLTVGHIAEYFDMEVTSNG